MDGYHKVPGDFKQMVSVFGYCSEKKKAFSIFHCLINSKTEQDYKFMFEEFFVVLKHHYPDFIWNPVICTTDFEKGLINAITDVFPNAHKSGCFFHFLQCQIRYFNSHGLLKKETKKRTYQILTLITFLCFINPAKIPKVFFRY